MQLKKPRIRKLIIFTSVDQKVNKSTFKKVIDPKKFRIFKIYKSFYAFKHEESDVATTKAAFEIKG